MLNLAEFLEECTANEASIVIIDYIPGLLSKLVKLTQQQSNKRVLKFDALDQERSIKWNFLDHLENDMDCELLADALCVPKEYSSAEVSTNLERKNNARAVLYSTLVGLLHDSQEECSITRLHEMIQTGLRYFCDWLEMHPHALRSVRHFTEAARAGSHESDIVMGEISYHLGLWDRQVVRELTAKSDFDLVDLIRQPVALSIPVHKSALELFQPLGHLCAVEIIRLLGRELSGIRGLALERPLNIILNRNACALDLVPNIHQKLELLSYQKVGILLYQSDKEAGEHMLLYRRGSIVGVYSASWKGWKST